MSFIDDNEEFSLLYAITQDGHEYSDELWDNDGVYLTDDPLSDDAPSSEQSEQY